MSNPEVESCSNCRYWFEIKDECPDEEGGEDYSDELSTGSCQRYPPSDLNYPPEWPTLVEGEWCGEWKETVEAEQHRIMDEQQAELKKRLKPHVLGRTKL